jgi:hypothetical protein
MAMVWYSGGGMIISGPTGAAMARAGFGEVVEETAFRRGGEHHLRVGIRIVGQQHDGGGQRRVRHGRRHRAARMVMGAASKVRGGSTAACVVASSEIGTKGGRGGRVVTVMHVVGLVRGGVGSRAICN